MKRIVLTGGGTAGHVMPNLAIIDDLSKLDWEIHYIGSYNGIERSLINKANIKYHPIRTGKLRRYFDIKNFLDPFNVLIGIFQSIYLMIKIKPSIVFSKGGFVAVPVIIAAWLNRVPSITHEGDITVGLANKLCVPFVKKICTAFVNTAKYLPQNKAVYTGLPIRREVFSGNKALGYELCGFTNSTPVILVMGGSLGSLNVNKSLRNILPELLKDYQVVHICGKGNVDNSLQELKGYKQFEFVTEELPHIFSISDIVISRAGTNSVFELLTLRKVCLFIPLSTAASRGEQILNAEFAVNNGLSQMITENNLSNQVFLDKIKDLFKNKDTYINNISKYKFPDGTAEIINLISTYYKGK
ncbi:undecaprenyldiphospho-muramoylpentapeptide beta-N-acetylglucosaminyltransferase [Pseudobacteroides cellulosolvens]|uniref:UDP-N-acetylglucosamine--N-acetylmuramyl-(pentapeptide) pyrophosphoryl-undecaprenol N-acetylglucosamine transferase n=1 Tax=Pseudobacteroides cellulosolvens ATCC 35603 = DSM 2933 TaxID=398512 RepID=A0A0L6JQC5_9FIRM|nr:undecaprenyldiphospho-muramoylpentapeptide beta-N-acetylglucosaminyltransferase [Pseudobacteroides cellulosolvens]KNY27890.1 UDP-N-acetylglucosamine--N-acetylmuramyl-(pentapeptide) pyrophosphoryl-undecaprenol N-acetylglucosamine transferase [Pseudobacteroides cellulosolvens ATCC 35603 = DSM 2933]